MPLHLQRQAGFIDCGDCGGCGDDSSSACDMAGSGLDCLSGCGGGNNNNSCWNRIKDALFWLFIIALVLAAVYYFVIYKK